METFAAASDGNADVRFESAFACRNLFQCILFPNVIRLKSPIRIDTKKINAVPRLVESNNMWLLFELTVHGVRV